VVFRPLAPLNSWTARHSAARSCSGLRRLATVKATANVLSSNKWATRTPLARFPPRLYANDLFATIIRRCLVASRRRKPAAARRKTQSRRE